MEEQWRPIDGFDGDYMVSDQGRVMSLKRKSPRIMPQTIQRTGYKAVMLWDSTTQSAKCRKVHRLVIEAFKPNPDNLPTINHIDGDKLNNHIDNLEWASYQDNMQHAVRTGLTHPHRWTDEERKEIAERNKQYAIDHGYQPKPKRTMAEYQAERKRKAEERRKAKALMPKPPRKKRKPMSAEARQRISERQTGKPHPRKSGTKGWKWSDEARQRLSAIRKEYYERKRRGSE